MTTAMTFNIHHPIRRIINDVSASGFHGTTHPSCLATELECDGQSFTARLSWEGCPALHDRRVCRSKSSITGRNWAHSNRLVSGFVRRDERRRVPLSDRPRSAVSPSACSWRIWREAIAPVSPHRGLVNRPEYSGGLFS